jgi:hypothetical protein
MRLVIAWVAVGGCQIGLPALTLISVYELVVIGAGQGRAVSRSRSTPGARRLAARTGGTASIFSR